MTTNFRLPDLGEGVHEAEILAVLVAAGDTVAEGQPMLEVETDKAAVEIPSPASGRVGEVRVAVGDIAHVGDILVVFGDVQANDAPPPAPKHVPTDTPPGQTSDDRQGPVPASPSTRRLARELGVDLRLVPASGAGGVVTREDVEAYVKGRDTAPASESEQQQPAAPLTSPLPPVTIPPHAPQPSPLPDFAKWGAIERHPFRSIRRATAAQMASSWSQIPHVHCEDSVDITRLEQFRHKHKEEIAAAGGRLTMTIFAMKAAATALKTYPHFNASLDLAGREIIVKNYFHIGIATDSDNGLFVPVIRDVDRKSIKELAVEVAQAVERVRSGKISRDQLQGGTFTITNAGALGGHRFSAIVNHPEVAILGLGQGRMQPVVISDNDGRPEIVPRLMMPIVLCFDHRVVDGADAIRFLRLIITALEDPDELFITMI